MSSRTIGMFLCTMVLAVFAGSAIATQSLSGKRSTIENIDSAWVREKLSGLSELLQDHTEAIGVFRTALKNVFPDKLVVRAVEQAGRTSFKMYEKVMPLNMLAESGLPMVFNSGAGT